MIRRWSLVDKCWVIVLAVADGWAAVEYSDGSRGTLPVGTLNKEPSDG